MTMKLPQRDASGRFIATANGVPAKRKVADRKPKYTPPKDIWVQFRVGSSYCGCGNRAIYSMSTKKEISPGKNPFTRPSSYGAPGSVLGMPLTQVWKWLKTKYTGKEIHLVFKRAATGYNQFVEHFDAWEFMELLENHPKEVTRVREFCNTNHSPANHLRMYSIHFVGKYCLSGQRPKDYEITDEMRKAL